MLLRARLSFILGLQLHINYLSLTHRLCFFFFSVFSLCASDLIISNALIWSLFFFNRFFIRIYYIIIFIIYYKYYIFINKIIYCFIILYLLGYNMLGYIRGSHSTILISFILYIIYIAPIISPSNLEFNDCSTISSLLSI
jgi:hypothetical protein